MNFRLVWMGPYDDPESAPPRRDAGSPRRSAAVLSPYAVRGAEMVHQEVMLNGRVKIKPVANFQARIVRDIALDDGEREQRDFGMEAVLEKTILAFTVSASEFSRMDWVLTKLGPRAIIYPGQHQHARTAIQWLSGDIQQERRFTHIGWRKLGDQWLYLHTGGALGVNGPVSHIQIQLPAALRSYHLQPSISFADRVDTIRQSLRFLRIAPDRISFPLLAGVYRAALGSCDFSIFLVGPSGMFKTALAALCQQHFGAGMNASWLPANFASTANALESLAFHAKDALLVADDFAPRGTKGNPGLQNIAERLFRSAGNQQGRNRMNGGQLRTPLPPRGLVLATGEDVPAGESIRARLLIVEVNPGVVNCSHLTKCQRAARRGEFAASLGSFLVWIAGQYDSLRERLRSRVEEIRNEGRGRAVHARLPGAAAELQAGFETFLEFALECGAITNRERKELARRNVVALNELIVRQARYQGAGDPALRFLQLLRAAVSAGQAYVSDRQGLAPREAAMWGWRRQPGRCWMPQGARIGWIDGPDLYLDPEGSYQVAQQMSGNEGFQLSEQTLRQRLRQHHLLVSVDSARRMLLLRRTLEGRLRQVLHLRAHDLAPAPPA